MHGRSRTAPVADISSPQATRPWAPMILALVAQVLVVIDISVVNTALPTIGADLDLRSSDLQWMVTAYLLFSGGGLLLGGRVADLMPRRLVFMTGLAIFTVASLANALAFGGGALIAGRAAQGAGAALMTPAALSIIMTTYVGAQRARGLALWGAIGGLGIAAGVTLGGMLTTWVGWESIFWVNVPVGVLALLGAMHRLPAEPSAHPHTSDLDLPGAITAVAGLATLMYTLANVETRGWAAPATLGGLAAAAILVAGFVLVERRAPRPLVHPHTWRFRPLVSGTAIMLGVTGLLMATVFLTSIFCQTVLGFSALEAGLAFLPLAVALVAGTHVATHVGTHLAGRSIAAGGLVLVAVALWLLSRVDAGAAYAAGIMPGLVVGGLGAGLVFAAVAGASMTGIPDDRAGMASGFLMTGHEVGAALGVAVIAALAGTAGSLTEAAGAVTAYERGSLAAAVLSLGFAVLAVLWMPAGKADVERMSLH